MLLIFVSITFVATSCGCGTNMWRLLGTRNSCGQGRPLWLPNDRFGVVPRDKKITSARLFSVPKLGRPCEAPLRAIANFALHP